MTSLKMLFNDSWNTSQIMKKELDICSWTDLSRKENTDLNRDCRKKLHKKKNDILGERSFGRLLMFGDSTVFRLSSISPFMKSLIINIPNYSCTRHEGSSTGCENLSLMKQLKAPIWNPPNSSLGEGPAAIGLDNPGCSDCIGCNMDFLLCQSNGRDPISQDTMSLHGGFIPIEFARDVELQSPSASTTQEVVATFLQEFYNTEQLVNDFGLPICVVNSGHHDVLVATESQFVENVMTYIGLLTPQCSMIVWITTNAPLGNTYPQQIELTRLWNEAVIQSFRSRGSNQLLNKLFVVDVYPASLNATHLDNVHMSDQWYIDLGEFLYQAFSVKKDNW